VSVDGASNRILEHDITPDVIVGDLDSVDDNTLLYFRSKVPILIQGVTVEQSQCQHTTDFEKCIKWIEERDIAESKITGVPSAEHAKDTIDAGVYALGALGGRLDQTYQNLNIIARYPQIVLYSNETMALALPPGDHVIYSKVGFEGPTCGILPVTGKSVVKTKGESWLIQVSNGTWTARLSLEDLFPRLILSISSIKSAEMDRCITAWKLVPAMW
jgi:thiamine pyrophosphokinase